MENENRPVRRKTAKTILCVSLLFALILIIILNSKANSVLKELSQCEKHIFSAATKSGETRELVCFVGDNQFDMDFTLNSKISSYERLTLKYNDSINTSEPVACVDMGIVKRHNNPGAILRLKGKQKHVSVIGNNFIAGEGVRAKKRLPNILSEFGAVRHKPLIVDSYFASPHIKDIYQEGFKKAVESGSDEILYIITLGDMPFYINTREYFYEPRPNKFLAPVSPPQKIIFPLYEYVHYILDIMYESEREAIWLKAGYSHLNYAGTEEFKGYIRRMKNESALRGKRFSCAVFPYFTAEKYSKYPFKDIHKYIKAFLDSESIPATDLSAPLLSGKYYGQRVSKCDLHPGPGAHYRAGKLLYGFISNNK